MDFLTHTANGKKIFFDARDSHLATHLKEYPQLLEFAKEALSDISPEADEYAAAIDLGRIIGETDLVEVTSDDELVYAKRRNRGTFTKFVKNRSPHPVSTIVVILHKIKEDSYQLWSAWFGELTPSFPGDDRETSESRKFWATHALIYGREEIVPGTETEVCPW